MKKYKILVLISFLLSSNVFSGEIPNISKRDYYDYYVSLLENNKAMFREIFTLIKKITV